jgi:mannose-1-phosphate guanylyltransferase/mannose-1-phosphate guanylyltransferase/mannose-6-phosphate isomerase
MQRRRPQKGRIQPVILCGGAGTRLWPLSRRHFPKQLQPLVSSRSMLQETAARVRNGTRFLPPIVICNEEHRFLIAEQLRECRVRPQAIVLEPSGRNTAPAAAVAAIMAAEADPDSVLLILPSDHVIGRPRRFQTAIEAAARVARAGHLVTFGIKPSGPATGYGYIRRGAKLRNRECFRVDHFIEKPDRQTAEKLLADGDTYWNSGMFVMSAAKLLREIERYEPKLLAACRRAVAKGREDLDFLRLDPKSFKSARSVPIDIAVMERTTDAAVLPVDIGWSDVGSWSVLHDLGMPDAKGNVKVGDVALHGVTNSYIRSEGPLVSAVGLDDVIIVATDDALLVAAADRAQEVGRLVEQLDGNGRVESVAHSTVHRPWGSFQTIDRGDGYQVKRITVKPGGRLSLQYHHHRAEHWVVIQGRAQITRGEEALVLEKNQSTYIPTGVAHRLENKGRSPLQLIEVQSGDYLGEDDIVRLEDVYRRS